MKVVPWLRSNVPSQIAPVLVALVAGSLGAPSSVRAQETAPPSPPEEVFQTELVYPQEQGEVQLTLSPHLSGAASQRTGQVPLTLEYGLTDAWQIELEWGGYTYGPSHGVGDLEIGAKYSFMNLWGNHTHAAVGLEVELPVDRADEEGAELEPFVILARDLPRLSGLQVFLHAAMGFELGPEEETPDALEADEAAWTLNTGAFLPLKPVTLTAELNWKRTGTVDRAYVTPGLVRSLPGGWEIGIGIPVGITPGADAFRVVGLLTYEFAFFGDDD